MKSLIPLFPFAAALSLLACQGNDGPVAEGATAPADELLGDAAATGLAAPANAAAAEAADQAGTPVGDGGMGWTSASDGTVANFGPAGARPMLTFACQGQDSARALVVTRLHPATDGASATLSFTGSGTASSMPMRAVAKAGGPGESEWRGEARGDVARAVARAFGGAGQVEVTLGGAPSLAVPTSPVATALFERCV